METEKVYGLIRYDVHTKCDKNLPVGSKVITRGDAQEYDNSIHLPFFTIRNAVYSFLPFILLYMKGKGKVIPLMAWCGLEGG